MSVDFYAGLPTEDQMGRPRRFQDPAKRLAARLEPDGECLVYTGSRNRSGYGWMSLAGTPTLAHRVAWMVHHDRPVPDGMYVLHSCDNPPCCNPDHLRIGTAAENSRDMVRRGRHKPVAGAANPRTKYSAETVELVRQLTADGWSAAAISDETGIGADYVRKLARGNRRSGSAGGPIDGPRRSVPQLPYEQIAADYEAGLTTIEVAERYGTHPGNVSRIIRRMGVQARPVWESRRRRAAR